MEEMNKKAEEFRKATQIFYDAVNKITADAVNEMNPIFEKAIKKIIDDLQLQSSPELLSMACDVFLSRITSQKEFIGAIEALKAEGLRQKVIMEKEEAK